MYDGFALPIYHIFMMFCPHFDTPHCLTIQVFFSMDILGSPTELLDHWKTGSVDLFATTRDEISAGGKEGFGKGVTSFIENVVGGTFSSIGKVSGGLAGLIDSAATNKYTSSALKPRAATAKKPASNVVEGFTLGTVFMGKAVVHGVVGVLGNPYRGMKAGTAKGVMEGAASGFTGLLVCPFVGALGFMAKVSEGAGEMAQISLGIVESRSRPLRYVAPKYFLDGLLLYLLILILLLPFLSEL